MQPPDNPNWTRLVERIRANDHAGMEELYALFGRGVRFYLCRQLGPQELDDRVHDLFLTIVQTIRRGELREPERLMGFIRTVVRRQVAACIDSTVQTRKDQAGLEAGASVCDARSNPEQDAIERQRADIMEKVLKSISARDREVLTRFYLHGHTAERICAEMNLTENQFRLLKSRAKARFAQMGRRTLEKHNNEISVRAQAASGH